MWKNRFRREKYAGFDYTEIDEQEIKRKRNKKITARYLVTNLAVTLLLSG